jgi:mono/diheme cytochrome c family protein
MRLMLLLCVAACAETPEALFSARCALCHADDGSGTDRGPALRRNRKLISATQIEDVIHRGTSGRTM